jgi:RNA polymerase sigma-70 factor, ECF subfamily
MSRDALANVLSFSQPGAGFFTARPSKLGMAFSNAKRLSGGHISVTEQDQPVETARQSEGRELSAANVKPGAISASPAQTLAGDRSQVALAAADLDRLSVQAALLGDQNAFADLVTRYQSAVYNMAYRMLGDPTEAEDAAQEVFVRAWNQLHTFQLDRRFSTWLLSIASHYCIDVLRRRRPAAPLDDVALYVESDEPAPDEIALQGEQADTVKRLLNRLPDKYRSVTVLRYYNDLSYEEIARVTGLTESAVKTQLHRARRMLAEQILGKGGTPHGVPDDLR